MAGLNVDAMVRRQRQVRIGDHGRIDDYDAFGGRKRLIVNGDGGDAGWYGGCIDGHVGKFFRLVSIHTNHFRFWCDDFQ